MDASRTQSYPGIIPDNIPQELRVRPQWVNFRLVRRDGRVDKVPYTPGSESKASTRDLLTWRSFDEAVAAYGTGRYDGIGLVFCSGDPYAGIDLDRCRDPETGELEGWAAEVVADLGGYAEVSPSEKGVHIIVRGDAPNSKRGQVEAYDMKRFFTVTGHKL
jgi:primase-polymerase (primpol)-like protein